MDYHLYLYASGFMGRDICRNICQGIHNNDYCWTWSLYQCWHVICILIRMTKNYVASSPLVLLAQPCQELDIIILWSVYFILLKLFTRFILVIRHALLMLTLLVRWLKRRQILWDVLVLNDTVNTLFSILTSPINYTTCQMLLKQNHLLLDLEQWNN